MYKTLKKKLLATALILAPFAAFADNDQGYVKAMIGMNKLNQVKNFDSIKQKTNFSPVFTLGVGGEVIDDIRWEVLFDYNKVNFVANHKFSEFNSIYFNIKNVVINSLSLNIYKDLLNINDQVKLFAGIGVGQSQIHETIEWRAFFPHRKDKNLIIESNGNNYRKISQNFSYSATLGVDFKVSNDISLEATYRFMDHGYTKGKKVAKSVIDKKHYFGHAVHAGIRYGL